MKYSLILLLFPILAWAMPTEIHMDGRVFKGDMVEVSVPTQTPRPTPTATPTPQPVAGKNLERFKGDWAYVKDTSKSEWTWALANPEIKGVAIRAMWNRDGLEPTDGHYDFSKIDTIANAAKAKGKAFVVFFMFQDYWGQDCVPAWFRSQGQVKEGNRCQPAIWRTAVADRMAKVIHAALNKYKNDDHFVGVTSGEISYPKMGPDFSVGGVEAGVSAITNSVGPAFKNSKAVFYLENNWSNRTDYQVTLATGYGAGLGHPDLTVSNKRLGNNPQGLSLSPSWGLGCYAPIARLPTMGSNTCAKTYKGTDTPLAISFQEGGRRSFIAGYSPTEVRDYAFKDLGVSIIFWDDPYSTPQSLGSILSAIKAKPYPY